MFDGAGERVDQGDAGNRAAETAWVGVPELDAGNHIVTWWVVSADGHPIKGAFVFTVGDAAAVDDDVVASLFAGGDDATLGVVGALNRGLGTPARCSPGLYLFVVARGDRRERDRAVRWVRRGAAVGLVTAADRRTAAGHVGDRVRHR